MGATIETTVEVNATPAEVIAKIVDMPGLPSWNTFMRHMEILSDHDSVVEGCQLLVKMEPKVGEKQFEFRPMVLEKTETSLRWLGKVGILFAGEHYFIAEPSPSGSGTLLRHGENFTGLAIPLFRIFGLKDTEEAFKRMNEDLKKAFA